jgi:hypothetical protein
MRILALVVACVLLADAQPAGKLPRFEDFPAPRIWDGNVAPLQLFLPSERMFRTRLTKASSEQPNFADHYRFTVWGCGSNCASGAFVDLMNGKVIPPPMTAGVSGSDRWMWCWQAFQGAGLWTRADSRLIVLRCGKTLIERLDDVVPDTYYFVLDGSRFQRIAHIRADETPPPK